MTLLSMIAMIGVLTDTMGVSAAVELRAVTDDLRNNVVPGERIHTRYVSLYAVPREEWAGATVAVSLVLNSVSRVRTIARPQAVPGSGGRLLRFSLRRYRIPSKQWEALIAADPYWHLRTKVIEPQTGAVREVFTDGGWLDLRTAAVLRALSGSGGAVVRADWFVAKAATTADDGAYYQLAGIPESEDEFFKQLGVDRRTVDKLRADEGANLFRSRITQKVRRVARWPGPLGSVWKTFDVEKSSPERDPFRNPFDFQYDAGEHIAVKSNGLHLFALYDAAGKRVDSVPDKIAKDTSDPHGDGIVAPMISCVRCHREDGLRPVVNDQRRLLAGRVDLLAERGEEAERLAAFYDTDLGKRLRRDREDYAEAVERATGTTSEEAADALATLFRQYTYRPVTPRQAARELGIPPTELKERLSASHDPIILALCEGIDVQRQQWEASFSEAAVLAKGASR